MRFLAILALALASLSLRAQSPAPAPELAAPATPAHLRLAPNDRAQLVVYYENDLFSGTDRYYTDGARITYLSPDLEALAPHYPWLAKVLDEMPFQHEGYTNNVGIAIGQDIYTPRDTTTEVADPTDQPYAGWLYGALSLHHKNATNLHTVELTLGVVGPASLAGWTQRSVHRARRLDIPQGWPNQLHNEPGMNLSYLFKHRLPAYQYGNTPVGGDFISSAGVTAGNVLTQATLGLTGRFGWNVPRDFQSTRIHASGYSPPAPDDPNRDWYRQLSLYVFASAEGRAVAHNIFLDGNTFADGPSVHRQPWVAEYEYGLGARYRNFRLTLTEVIRTLEFRGQKSFQRYGAITAGYEW